MKSNLWEYELVTYDLCFTTSCNESFNLPWMVVQVLAACYSPNKSSMTLLAVSDVE